MKVSVLSYCIFILAGYFAILGIMYLVLEFLEKTDSVAKKWSFGLLGVVAALGICYVVGIPFNKTSQVIAVRANGWHKESDWLFSYRHEGKSYPVQAGKWYVFNEDSQRMDLVLTPVYYHINPDSVGRKVPHLAVPDTLRGVFIELSHNPVFLFHPPDTVVNTYVICRALVLYHLGIVGSGQEIPDTYRRLEFQSMEYNVD